MIAVLGDTYVTELSGHTEIVQEDGDDKVQWVDTDSNNISFELLDPQTLNDRNPVWAFENEKEYKWDFFVKTPTITDVELVANDPVPLTWSTNDENNTIIWAQSEDPSKAPSLSPNKLYCFEFTKLTNGIFIGRIKYFISLLKKNMSDT